MVETGLLPSPPTWGSDIAYAAGFAAQPSMGEQQTSHHHQPSPQSQSPFAPSSAIGGHQRNGGHDAGQDRRSGYQQQAPPVLYSSALDWKKDTHPSYTSPPPLEPPKDYSHCPAFSLGERTPRVRTESLPLSWLISAAITDRDVR
jgi:hypothetical protein